MTWYLPACTVSSDSVGKRLRELSRHKNAQSANMYFYYCIKYTVDAMDSKKTKLHVHALW